MADLPARLARLEGPRRHGGCLLGDMGAWRQRYGRALVAVLATLPKRYLDALVNELGAAPRGTSPLGQRCAALAAAAAWSEGAPWPYRGPLVVPAAVAALLTGEDAIDAAFCGLVCRRCLLEAPYSRRRLKAAQPWPVDPLAVSYSASCEHCGGALAWARPERA